MSVKTASELLTRAMRSAFRETISPANQGSKESNTLQPLSEAGDVSRQFGHELRQHVDVYTASADEFVNSGNTVDSWRMQFSHPTADLKAANRDAPVNKRQA
ncbi:MAG: hypothetical protein AAGA21_09920 [Pseudomonadota bacterium]